MLIRFTRSRKTKMFWPRKQTKIQIGQFNFIVRVLFFHSWDKIFILDLNEQVNSIHLQFTMDEL